MEVLTKTCSSFSSCFCVNCFLGILRAPSPTTRRRQPSGGAGRKATAGRSPPLASPGELRRLLESSPPVSGGAVDADGGASFNITSGVTGVLQLCYRFTLSGLCGVDECAGASGASYVLYPSVQALVVQIDAASPTGTTPGCDVNVSLTGAGFSAAASLGVSLLCGIEGADCGWACCCHPEYWPICWSCHSSLSASTRAGSLR